MNRSRRLVALAQEEFPADSPATDCGYNSEGSSPAQSLDSILEDIDIDSPGKSDSDDSIKDPDFVVPPKKELSKFELNGASDSSDSEMENLSEMQKELNALESVHVKGNNNSQTDNIAANIPATSAANALELKRKMVILSDIKLPKFSTSLTSETVVSSYKKKKKRTLCKFCLNCVSNFERHLERNHTDCKEVVDMLSYPKKHSERKNILNLIRNSGNFNEFLKGKINPKYGRVKNNTEYYPCHRCKAILKKEYLSRHRKKCVLNKISEGHNTINKFSEASASQTLIACSLDENSTLDKLRVIKEVFPRMKADNISFVAKTDSLICKFGENYLKKHKREQLNIVCSNKMRELARFLIEFRKISNFPECALKDVLMPKLFDTVIEAAKNVGGYDKEKKTYRAASLSAHLGTSLKQVSDLFISMLLKEDPCVSMITQREDLIKEKKRFRQLIETQWTTEISSLAFKNIQEQRWNKPVMLPLTSDIKKFKEYVSQVADQAVSILKESPVNKKEFKNLVEASLALTVLFNRRRIGDVQYTNLKTYTDYKTSNNQEECETALSETEKILTKRYKRFVTGGKGSRAIAILLPTKLQEYINFFIDIRMNYDMVPNDNPYLFGCPGTTKWARGDVIIRKLAVKSGIQHANQISSNKLRKQIATVMQILNLSSDELDQFANFMGHTEKTHNEFYKLPQDVYQTAKVSKLLLLMEKGADKFKGKSLKDIDINPDQDVAEEDSNNELENMVVPAKEEVLKLISSKAKVDSGKHQKAGIVGRTSWNEQQIQLLKNHFADHIRMKIPPKKKECVDLYNKHSDILYNKDWVRIKTFVYNTYRSK